MPEQVLNNTQEPPPGPPNFARWLAFFVAAALLPASCLVPPNIDAPGAHQVVAAVKIVKNKADPTILTPVIHQRAALNRVFDITVDHPAIEAVALRYNWYFDYSDTVTTLDQTVVCPTSQNRCVLFPCSLPDYSADHHRLMVVVSDLPLRVTEDQSHDPFDFPAGAHFDSVSWDIELKGVCPGK